MLQWAGVRHHLPEKDGVVRLFTRCPGFAVSLLRQAELSLWWGGNIEYSERGLHGQFQRFSSAGCGAISKIKDSIL
jgi:hypothetical protein